MDYTCSWYLSLNSLIPVIGCTAVGIRSKTIEIKKVHLVTAVTINDI